MSGKKLCCQLLEEIILHARTVVITMFSWSHAINANVPVWLIQSGCLYLYLGL